MIQLYQAEWCPYCRRVRHRLTELGIDFVARQVPANGEDRDELARIAGERSIPALVLEDGSVISGSESIHAHLDTIDEPPGAADHRAKAAKMRQRKLEEARR